MNAVWKEDAWMLDESKIAMLLGWRPMQLADVCACMDIIAADPVIGPRYGAALEDLGYAWRHLLGSAAMTTSVFVRSDRNRQEVVGFSVSVFVSDRCIREIKTPPLSWFGPELAKRVGGRNSPILTDSEVRDANSGEGLNELVWESLAIPEIAQRPEFYHVMLGSFIEAHRGFFFNELITSQSGSAERMQCAVDSGGLYWNPSRRCYQATSPEPTGVLVTQPYIVGITRDLAFARHGSWVGTLFDYRPPQFGVSRGEQQLLLTALASSGGTDHELAGNLRLSVPTIKKMWSSIYRRVNASNPELIPDSALAESGTRERGREKKRSLLAYIREHPEELRLHSPKLLTASLHRQPAEDACQIAQ
ncbi:MAG: hypothetical protein ABI386_09445 [Rhodanobacter sp.]